MCGIVGFIDKKRRFSQEEKASLIRSMADLVSHRGRDGEGRYVDDDAALGHTRLSILDPHARADQPFFSDDGSVIAVYNGEIYNFRELNEQLKPHAFRTHSDTETFVAAYQAWGLEALNRFRGMFAFALYEKERQRIILAVDRFAIKPIYYFENESLFAFASEAKALFVLPGIEPEFNTAALDEYLLFRQTAGAETLWKGVRRLLPSQVLTYDIARAASVLESYWEPDVQDRPLSEGELSARVEDSVRSHLLSDVPVGIQLSGGVDSSLVAALAKRIKPTQFHTFSIGLKEDAWNEFPYSRAVAKLLSSEHHELVFTEEEFCRALPEATFHHDEPVNHPHSIPMMLLSRFARTHVKVLLSGEGADELFGGYKRYPRIAASNSVSDEDLLMLSAFGDAETWKRLLGRVIAPTLEYRREILQASSGMHPIKRVLLLDQRTYLQSMLIRQDKMGMAGNVESRVPFLDPWLAEASHRLPVEELTTVGETKRALKNVAREYLPSEIIDRPKCGFGLPIGAWLKNENGLGKYLFLLLAEDTFISEYVDPKELASVIREHQEGRQDHTEALWILLNLELWARIFFRNTPHEEIWPAL